VAATERRAVSRYSHSWRSNVVDVDSSRRRSSLWVRMRFAAAAHPLRGRASGLHDEAAALRVHFDFVGQVGLVEERLRNPNTRRVSDPHDTVPVVM
jgi:hypothetical protein